MLSVAQETEAGGSSLQPVYSSGSSENGRPSDSLSGRLAEADATAATLFQSSGNMTFSGATEQGKLGSTSKYETAGRGRPLGSVAREQNAPNLAHPTCRFCTALLQPFPLYHSPHMGREGHFGASPLAPITLHGWPTVPPTRPLTTHSHLCPGHAGLPR